MKHERYMSWFREVVEMGWACGLYAPQEILLNYARSFHQYAPPDEEFPYEHVERFLIDITKVEWSANDTPTLKEAIESFNAFYDNTGHLGVDFSIYTKLGAN